MKSSWPGASLLLLFLALAGCTAIAQPRFPVEVASAIAAEPMRRLETDDLEVFYPEGRRAEAERFGGWAGGCVRDLRRWTKLKNGLAQRKPFVIMPGPAINNALVLPPLLGFETASVVTSHSTYDFLVDLGMPPDPAIFGCHEMVHWEQMMQIGGFFWLLDRGFGDLVTPQIGLDAWFHEGLATLYESRLQAGLGRMVSPLWEGAFHAGVAGQRIDGGTLSVANRGFSFGNHYLVGSRFLRFLVERYGEEKIWALVHKQATAFFFPLWVNLRFWQVYDKTLSTLIDEFAAEVEQRYPERPRPPGQRTVRQLGHAARYAVARDGSEAIVSDGFDQPTRLEIFAPDGQLRRRRDLEELWLPRTLVQAGALVVSGLSFTRDGGTLYFTVIDRGAAVDRVRLVRYQVAADRLDVVEDDLGGPGGAVAEDGSVYFFARAQGDRHQLAVLDLGVPPGSPGRVRTLAPAAPGVFLGSPRPAPDGRRLIATVAQGNVTRLVIFDRASGQPIGPAITAGASAVDPWFLDDERIVFAGETGGRYQAFVHDLASGRTTQASDAPYLALAPRPRPDGKLRVLNREGWGWTLDEVEPRAGSPVTLTAAPPAGEALAPPPPVTARVLADEPYSVGDTLFFPQLRSLSGVTFPDSDRSATGASIGGGDRLGFHRWALSGYLDVSKSDDARFSGSIGYANSQLAPLLFALQASYLSWWDTPRLAPRNRNPLEVDAAELTVSRRQRTLAFEAALPFYTHLASLTLFATEEQRRFDPDAPEWRRLGGASAGLTLGTGSSTPYTGPYKALSLSLDAAYFPDQLSNVDFTFADLRAELAGRFPLPPSTRLGLFLSGRVRTLAGAPAGSGLLEVGGGGAFGQLYRHRDVPDPPKDPAARDLLDPLPITFQEPMRGYEDRGFLADRIAIADVRFNYPVIIDRGFASSLVILPSFFVRQLDVDTFATAARDPGGRPGWHAAVGGSLTLRTLFWVVPLSLRYQLAKRLRDDHALVHFIGLGAI